MADCRERVFSEEYQDYLIEHSGDWSLIKEWYNVECYQQASERFAVVYLAGEAVQFDVRLGAMVVPRCYGLLSSERVLEEMGVSQVQRQPALGLFGDGIIVGFVDTGIDYTHPAFLGTDGTSRILSIWDQSIDSEENTPEQFSFGREFTNEEINAALQAENPLEIVPTRDTIGHGTFMAGVACGTPSVSGMFSGVAPLSDICVVKCKQAKKNLREYYQIGDDINCYSEGDIILGVRYLWEQSLKWRRPIVICIGMGTNMGGHIRGGVLGELLQSYGDYRGTYIVAAAGNEANTSRHYQSGMVPAGGSEDVELRVAEGRDGFTMELWSDAPQLYSVGLVSPSGEYSGRTVARQGERREIRFLLEETEVTIEYLVVAQENGDECIFMRFRNPQEGIWKLRVFSENNLPGYFHIWLPTSEILQSDTYFLRANPDITICDPANNMGIITAAYYNSNDRSVNIDSSRGYSRDGLLKPDIAAPGVEVLGPMPFLGNAPGTTPMEREDMARYGFMSGSSVGAALTAGVVSLLVEWGFVRQNDLSMDTTTVKRYLIRGANRTGMEYPNRLWGNGLLDLFGVFDALRPK
ncbi:MAG: S8 family peptidase [Lachnospiraceae bacterium]|nr:S8 family peptidase [Lachnospiraceae bacterium]